MEEKLRLSEVRGRIVRQEKGWSEARGKKGDEAEKGGGIREGKG